MRKGKGKGPQSLFIRRMDEAGECENRGAKAVKWAPTVVGVKTDGSRVGGMSVSKPADLG